MMMTMTSLLVALLLWCHVVITFSQSHDMTYPTYHDVKLQSEGRDVTMKNCQVSTKDMKVSQNNNYKNNNINYNSNNNRLLARNFDNSKDLTSMVDPNCQETKDAKPKCSFPNCFQHVSQHQPSNERKITFNSEIKAVKKVSDKRQIDPLQSCIEAKCSRPNSEKIVYVECIYSHCRRYLLRLGYRRRETEESSQWIGWHRARRSSSRWLANSRRAPIRKMVHLAGVPYSVMSQENDTGMKEEPVQEYNREQGAEWKQGREQEQQQLEQELVQGQEPEQKQEQGQEQEQEWNLEQQQAVEEDWVKQQLQKKNESKEIKQHAERQRDKQTAKQSQRGKRNKKTIAINRDKNCKEPKELVTDYPNISFSDASKLSTNLLKNSVLAENVMETTEPSESDTNLPEPLERDDHLPVDYSSIKSASSAGYLEPGDQITKNKPGFYFEEEKGKRGGYTDISELCIEFHCGSVSRGTFSYLKCINNNHCIGRL